MQPVDYVGNLARDLHIDVNDVGVREARAEFNAMRRSDQEATEEKRDRRSGTSRVEEDLVEGQLHDRRHD